jgi:hypothetical protein
MAHSHPLKIHIEINYTALKNTLQLIYDGKTMLTYDQLERNMRHHKKLKNSYVLNIQYF